MYPKNNFKKYIHKHFLNTKKKIIIAIGILNLDITKLNTL